MRRLSYLLMLTAIVLLCGCGGNSKPPAIGVSLSPSAALTIVQGQQKSLSVTVSNDSKNQGVTWTLAGTGCTGPACGALTNATATSVMYNAPTSVSSNMTVSVTATSVADATKSASVNITVVPAPSVTTTSLPNGVQNAAYTATTLAASGGITPYTWSVSVGSLPAGMTLSTAGVISGTPTAAATSNFTVQVADSSSPALTATKALSIVVNPPPPLTITTTSLPGGAQNTAYAATLAASGGTPPYTTWSLTAGALPAGLTLHSTTGVIDGTPTAAGTSDFTVQVSDSTTPALNATKALSITIAPPPLTITTSSLPGGTIHSLYTATTLQSSGGTPPVTWSITAGSLPAGLTLNSSTGVISGTPTVSGTIDFTVTATDSASTPEVKSKALSIVVNPALSVTTTTLPDGSQDAAYTATLTSTGGTSPVTWAVSVGTLPTGLTLNSSTGVISGTPTTAGKVDFTVEGTDSSTPKQTSAVALSITVAPPPLTIITTSLPGGTVNSTYTATTLQYSGGTPPVTWAVTTGSLPAGLTLHGTTGVIDGTPTASGTVNFTVTATDSEPTPATKTQALSIVVNPALSITTSSLADGAMNTAYTVTLASSGGTAPVTWSVSAGDLPAGLTLNNTTGVISGTPTTAGKVDFTVQATDHSTPPATPQKALSITIAAVPLAITTTSLPGAIVSGAYSATLNATGGTPPVTWTVTTGGLPAGLTLNGATGVIDGMPTGAGTVDFTVTATDAGSPVQTKTQALSIVVAPAFTITTTSLPDGTQNTAYPATTLTVTGGAPPFTFTVNSGALPAGLNLNSSTGVISGTPTAAGTSNFSVKATDHSTPPQTPEVALSITIAAVPLAITTTTLPNGTIGSAYSATLQATGGTPPLFWTVSAGALPGWATLDKDTGAITGTPDGSPATTTFTVTATDSGSPVQTKTQFLSISTVTGGVNNAELNGHYAFVLRGFDSIGHGLVTIAGSFAANGSGSVTGGVMDINTTSNNQTNLAITGGFYSVGADQRGTVTLTTSQGNSTFAFSLGGITSGVASVGHMIGSDSNMVAGDMKKQDTTAFSTASFNGNFAFGLGGAVGAGRFSAAGVMTADGTGSFSISMDNNAAGEMNGGSSSPSTLAGTWAISDATNGRGTMNDTTNGSHMALYVVSASEAFIIEIDPFNTNGPPMFAGSALKQSGTFSNSSMNGTKSVFASQSVSTYSGGVPAASYTGVGLFSWTTTGNLTGEVDENDGGTVTHSAGMSGTYNVASNGRMTMTVGGNTMPLVFYLVSPGKAFSVGTNGAVAEGFLKPQSGSSFTNGSISGNFIFGAVPPVMSTSAVDVGVVTLDGAGHITGTDDQNDAGISSTNSITDTYAVAANGRVVLGESIMYVISTSKAVMMRTKMGETDPTIHMIDK